MNDKGNAQCNNTGVPAQACSTAVLGGSGEWCSSECGSVGA